MFKYIFSFSCIFLLSACSFFDLNPAQVPLQGERISILDLQRGLSPAMEADPTAVIIVPEATLNANWPQRGGNANNVMGNLKVGESQQLNQIWRADIGQGSTKDLPLTAHPVVAGGQIFTLDTESRVRAFNTQTGKMVWQRDVSHPSEDEDVISGGLAYDSGRLFVTSGYNEVLALAPENGEIMWRTRISAGSRAAPSVKNGRVFITALNNNAIAIEAQTGRVLWEYEGVGETTGLLGAASPAVDEQMVIPAFSSGDIVALRVENGSVLWGDSLANTLRLGGMAGLSDIRALPIIHGDIVMAVSFGGKMAAYDKRNGNLIWQTEISSAETPWVAGNSVYVLSSDYKLIALNLETGELLWARDVQKYANRQDRKGLLSWAGPVMASGRLILAGTQGRILEFNPQNGEEITKWSTRKTTRLAPVIAEGTLYIMAEDGSLIAYR